MATWLKMDTVQGAEVDFSPDLGRIIRMGIAHVDLPSIVDPAAMALLVTNLPATLVPLGCPELGDRFPSSDYNAFTVRRILCRPMTASLFSIAIIYKWDGLLKIRDSSSLSSVPTQLHPKDFKPLYVSYTFPGSTTAIKKTLTLNTVLPMRHIIAEQTIDHTASQAVLDAFGSVNKTTWNGKPPGYWLYSGLEGSSEDGDITYTYACTFSTKQKENWLQLGFIEDDTGKPIFVDPTAVAGLRAAAYFYGQNATVPGVLLTGMYPMVEFNDLFGFGGPPPGP